MPERFLLQVLRNLVNHGILQSTRGVEGGYMLSRHPDQISLLEVIEAIDGRIDTSVPVTEGLSEPMEEKLKTALAHITVVARQQLEAIKISHLLPGHPVEQHV